MNPNYLRNQYEDDEYGDEAEYGEYYDEYGDEYDAELPPGSMFGN